MTFNPGPYPIDDVVETIIAFASGGKYLSVRNAYRQKRGRPTPTLRYIHSYLQTGESPKGRDIDTERRDVDYWDIQAAVEFIGWKGDEVAVPEIGKVVGAVLRYLHFDFNETDNLKERDWIALEVGTRVPSLDVTINRTSYFENERGDGWRIVGLTDEGNVVVWFRATEANQAPPNKGARLRLHNVRIAAKTEHDEVRYSRIDYEYFLPLAATP